MVKEALHKAFQQMGGVRALVSWGREDPTEFYKLWVKTLPREIKAEIDGVVTLTMVVEAAQKLG